MPKRLQSNFALLLGFFFFTALLRIASATLSFFPMGFSPMQSVSLFSRVLIKYRWLAYLFPLLIIFGTDSVINYFFTRNFSPFYPGFYWQYLSFFLITLLGRTLLKSPSIFRVLFASVAGATVFFAVSNFGAWVSSGMYSMDFQGLLTCYFMALPFYAKDIFANLVFSSVIYAIMLASPEYAEISGSREQAAR